MRGICSYDLVISQGRRITNRVLNQLQKYYAIDQIVTNAYSLLQNYKISKYKTLIASL